MCFFGNIHTFEYTKYRLMKNSDKYTLLKYVMFIAIAGVSLTAFISTLETNFAWYEFFIEAKVLTISIIFAIIGVSMLISVFVSRRILGAGPNPNFCRHKNTTVDYETYISESGTQVLTTKCTRCGQIVNEQRFQ